MKLIDLLVKELPKRGGWPEGAESVVQDADDTEFYFFTGGPVKNSGRSWWFTGDDSREDNSHWIFFEGKNDVADDCNSSIITRSQYESALAKNDGWIEWGGGNRPVDGEAYVDVKLRGGHVVTKRRADTLYWNHYTTNGDGEIMSYRLHRDINSHSNDEQLEQDLNECIGQDVDPAWNGEGLPPVGTICEAKVPRPITGCEWREVKVVESGIPGAEKEALVYDLETTSPSWADEFRPLRTEAERAREDAETAMRTCLAGTGAGITPLAAKGIYEAIAAGKIPGVKLESK